MEKFPVQEGKVDEGIFRKAVDVYILRSLAGI